MRLADEGFPLCLSPDGRWALVRAHLVTFEAQKWPGLRVVPTGTGDVRTIAAPGLQVVAADWVPDGRGLLVYGREADRGLRAFLLDAGGQGRRAVTPEGVSACEVGRRGVACLGPTKRVTFYSLEGGESREVPGLEPGLRPLRLSEDETSLFVSPPRANRVSPLRVERVDLATGRRTLVQEFKPADMAGVWIYRPPLVTPDGRGYAYGYAQWLQDLYLADGFR